MKNLILMSAIAMSGLFNQTAIAQTGFHINVNLGSRPVVIRQVPVYHDADYFYLPDVEAYYSVNQNSYYYQEGGRWVNAAYLPGRYHDYDWQHVRRFAVNEPRPYLHNDAYRARYGGFEGRRDWNSREGQDNRAYAERGHFDNVRDQGYFDDRNNNRYDGRRNDRSDERNNYRQQNNDRDNRGNNRDNRGRNDEGRRERF